MQEIYTIDITSFTEHGLSITTNRYILDTIVTWEHDFHSKHKPLFATHLYANYKFMCIIDRNLLFDETYQCGMELIDGAIDIETNLKIDDFSQYRTIYALGSEIEENLDEPLFLVKDDSLHDGVVIFKHIADNDTDEEHIPLPVESITIKVD